MTIKDLQKIKLMLSKMNIKMTVEDETSRLLGGVVIIGGLTPRYKIYYSKGPKKLALYAVRYRDGNFAEINLLPVATLKECMKKLVSVELSSDLKLALEEVFSD